MFNMLASFAEFEQSLIRECQREGIAVAKRAGVYRGRKPSLTAEQVKEIRRRVMPGNRRLAWRLSTGHRETPQLKPT